MIIATTFDAVSPATTTATIILVQGFFKKRVN